MFSLFLRTANAYTVYMSETFSEIGIPTAYLAKKRKRHQLFASVFNSRRRLTRLLLKYHGFAIRPALKFP